MFHRLIQSASIKSLGTANYKFGVPKTRLCRKMKFGLRSKSVRNFRDATEEMIDMDTFLASSVTVFYNCLYNWNGESEEIERYSRIEINRNDLEESTEDNKWIE